MSEKSFGCIVTLHNEYNGYKVNQTKKEQKNDIHDS